MITFIRYGTLDPNRHDYTAIVSALHDQIWIRIFGYPPWSLPFRRPIDQRGRWLPHDAVAKGRVRLWNTYVSDEIHQELDQHMAYVWWSSVLPQYRMFCEHQASRAYLLCSRNSTLVESGMLPAVEEFGPHLMSYEVSSFTQACKISASQMANQHVRQVPWFNQPYHLSR